MNGRVLGAFTPMHVAAEGGNLELLEELLQVGQAALRPLRAPGCSQGWGRVWASVQPASRLTPRQPGAVSFWSCPAASVAAMGWLECLERPC